MKKLLIIAYYWPPSGGAGVQRWLKLSKYLALDDIEIHVITVKPDQASYLQRDESLCNDIHPSICVHQTDTFEPLNYYAKLVGQKNVPTAGFSNVNTTSRKQRIIASIRSNLFIPDPRKGWKKYAVKKALELIEEENIEHVVTTSPPHSVQLIGLELKKHLGDKIRWISDMRDPWTDIYYYELLNHSKWSHKKDKAFERAVVEQSDAMVTIGSLFKNSLLSKTTKINSDKITTIPNGYDHEDFVGKETIVPPKNFTITYTGTISDYYEPHVFFIALGKLIKKYPGEKICFKLVGMVSDKIRAFIIEQIPNDQIEFVPMVQHDEAIKHMLEAHVLLLITQGEKGTIPGKTFEYLAAKRRIICIGTGDAASIIEECQTGKGFDRSQENEVVNYLEQAYLDFKAGIEFKPNSEKVIAFSRKAQAAEMKKFIFN